MIHHVTSDSPICKQAVLSKRILVKTLEISWIIVLVYEVTHPARIFTDDCGKIGSSLEKGVCEDSDSS